MRAHYLASAAARRMYKDSHRLLAEGDGVEAVWFLKDDGGGWT